MLAGASGGVFALLLRGLRSRKSSLSLIINGILGGLVSITASSAYVTLAISIIIGAVGSVWIILFTKLLEELKIDDPVGAIPVHLGCGIWGTFAVGLFANPLPPYINHPIIRIEQILAQIMGIIVVNLTTLVFSLVFWLGIGLAIYLLESLNNIFQPSSTKLLPAKDFYPQKNLFYRYLHFARQALRVSQEEELNGSDGTFS